MKTPKNAFGPDDNDDAGEQELRILVQTAGAGPYLSLQTKRWAFDHPNELEGLLQHATEAVVSLFAAGEEPPP